MSIIPISAVKTIYLFTLSHNPKSSVKVKKLSKTLPEDLQQDGHCVISDTRYRYHCRKEVDKRRAAYNRTVFIGNALVSPAGT